MFSFRLFLVLGRVFLTQLVLQNLREFVFVTLPASTIIRVILYMWSNTCPAFASHIWIIIICIVLLFHAHFPFAFFPRALKSTFHLPLFPLFIVDFCLRIHLCECFVPIFFRSCFFFALCISSSSKFEKSHWEQISRNIFWMMTGRVLLTNSSYSISNKNFSPPLNCNDERTQKRQN